MVFCLQEFDNIIVYLTDGDTVFYIISVYTAADWQDLRLILYNILNCKNKLCTFTKRVFHYPLMLLIGLKILVRGFSNYGGKQEHSSQGGLRS